MTDREWRESADLRPMRGYFVAVLAVAALLRFWGLGAGIPYAVGVDEPEVVDRVVQMMKSGDFHPHFFDYPGLIFYLHLPIVVLRFIVGAMEARWDSLGDVGPTDFFLWARATTALLGTATVYLVHAAGLRWGARHALLGAGMLAVMPLHVRESHFALTDVPMTFFVALTWVLSLRAHEQARVSAFAMAGVAAGLAMSCKYNAGLVVVLPLVAIWMTVPTRPSRAVAALATLGGWLAAFLLTSPYALLDLPAFLNAFAYLAAHFKPRDPSAESGALIYFKHLRLAFQWPAVLLLFGGLGLALVRAVKGPGRVRWVLIALFPLLYFWTITDREQIFARYLLPLVPFACLLVGIAVVSGVGLLRRFDFSRAVRTAIIVGLTVAAVVPPAVSAVAFNRSRTAPSTQQAAWEWIEANIPRGTIVVLEKYDLRLPPQRYRVTHVKRLIDRSLDDHRAAGTRFLVASSQVYGPTLERPDEDPALTAAYRTLFRSVREAARFSPDGTRKGPELRILAIE